MRILGIDPGTIRMGYGVIDEVEDAPKLVACGVLRASVRHSPGERLRLLYDGLKGLIGTYGPQQMAIESPFVARNVRSAMAIGEARALAVLLASQHKIHLAQYSPAQIKSAVTNYGAGDKALVQEWVKLLLGMPSLPQPYDAADALAVAICHQRHCRVQGPAS